MRRLRDAGAWMRRAAMMAAVTAATVVTVAVPGCSASDPVPTHAVIVESRADADLPIGIRVAVGDLQGDLGRLHGRPATRALVTSARCVPGETHVVVVAEADPTLGKQAYKLDEQRCADDGHRVVVRGGSQLATQWAVYELLEALGVRYFHPEQTLYPLAATWPVAELHVSARPSFEARSFHAHRTHPIELSPPLDALEVDTIANQKHWVDWNVKVRSTEIDGLDAVASAYAYDRGFPRGAGMNLVEDQQGGVPVIDPDDPRPEHEQIAAAIDARMAAVPGAPPVSSFGFLFNPNEVTTVDENLTLDRITFVTEYINARWPGVEVRTINHGTHQGPGPVFGVRFFDLPELAPPSLAVWVHPLMFYDLDRPAPVYGNQDFRFLRDWIAQQQAVRRIYYYPESSWWLTFDLPVPLYLAPVSLEARDHDLQLLKPYVPTSDGTATHGVVGHHTFTSGQEWGYWLIDYCTARMTWDLDLGWKGCLAHVATAFVGGDALAALWATVGEAQVTPMRDPAVLAMLVGSDDETETAQLAGIEFHPLPPRPSDVLAYDDAQAATFERASVTPLPAMAAQYAAWADAAQAIADRQPASAAPWVAEVADGLRITGLRAAHSHAVYATTLALRAAIRAHDFAAVQAAQTHLAEITALTEQARGVVTTREAAYRYPLKLSIAGDERGTPGAVPNETVYPFRYLSRTHRLFYWTRPDAQVAALFGGDRVTVPDRMIADGVALEPALLADGVSELAISWGDGATSTVLESHVYAAEGVYDWTLDAVHAAGVIAYADRAAVVARRVDVAPGQMKITAPDGAGLIEGLLPGLAVGTGVDATGAFTAIGTVEAGTTIDRSSIVRAPRSGNATAAFDLELPLRGVGAVTVFGAVVSLADLAVTITGELSTQQVIDLVVATGAFDPDGARDAVAGQLGYTSATLPARVPVTLAAAGVAVF